MKDDDVPKAPWENVHGGQFCHLCVTDWTPPHRHTRTLLHTHSFLNSPPHHTLAYTLTHTSQPHLSRWWREEVWAALGSREGDHVTKISAFQLFFFSLFCITCFFVSVCPAECDKLRKDGFRSSQYYSQGPTFSDNTQSTSSLQDDEDDDNDKKVHMCTDTYTHSCARVAITVFQLYTVAVGRHTVCQSGADLAAWQLIVSVCPLMVILENAPWLIASKTHFRPVR